MSDTNPLFSIIVVDYEKSISRPLVDRVLLCLLNQSNQDFEIILIHDGPKEIEYAAELNPLSLERVDQVIVTASRFNDHGHSLRDIGINKACGQYVLHLNADNVLYPFALEEIASVISATLPRIEGDQGKIMNAAELVIFPIIMRGMVYHHNRYYRIRNQTETLSVVLNGIPPKAGNIDCMQLVMKRSLWLKEGGWSDKTENSDGLLYQRFCKKYGIRTVARILGEHY